MNEAPKPHRRWFAFSLRTLLLLVTIFCVWFGWWVESARRQKDAVQGILKAGGGVYYDYQMIVDKKNPGRKRSDDKANDSTPLWMRNLFGIDFFHRVTRVLLGGTSIKKADLDNLQPLFPDLESLSFCATKIDGHRLTEVAWLKNCSRLEWLELRGARISNDSMKVLKKLTRLKYLGLYGVPVSDEGLENLASLTNLDTLVLDGTQITDAGLSHIRHLPKLRRLGLQGTQVTSSGVAELRKALTECEISSGH